MFKSVIIEMKDLIVGFNRRFEELDKRICKFWDKIFEMI